MTRDVADMWHYDLWANRLWIDTLLKFPEPKRPDEVMTHVLFAQWIWLQRCNDFFKLDLDLPAKPEAPSVTLAEQLNGLWLLILDRVRPEQVLDYTNLAGKAMSVPFGDVVRHVPNHGTYHRGHLRGLAEAQAVTDYPETDFSLWSTQAKAGLPG
jgi:uncharacterized damage-inducible protein DinB